MQDRIKVGVVFGGVSVEHEVSVITALQAAAAMDATRYEPIPIYISKAGRWYTGVNLLDIGSFKSINEAVNNADPVAVVAGETGGVDLLIGKERHFGKRRSIHLDVLFLGLHGSEGENGSLQGMCESLDVAYTGSGVLGSAVGMDKILSKRLAREAGIPVVSYVELRRALWVGGEETALDQCERELGYPVVVKPARLGSSVGISLVDNRVALDRAVEDAFAYDEKVVVEKAVNNLREINCSVLGDADDARVSVLEEPVRSGSAALLSYEEKYQREGGKSGSGKTDSAEGMAAMDRLIPAPISSELADRIRKLAKELFRLFECAGVARIDWMLDGDSGELFFNEINTIPGSLSFYLWEPTGVSFDELVHKMIEVAFHRQRLKLAKTRSYDTNLLSVKSLGGMKGAK